HFVLDDGRSRPPTALSETLGHLNRDPSIRCWDLSATGTAYGAFAFGADVGPRFSNGARTRIRYCSQSLKSTFAALI
ncbi:hypothetical protein JMJ77_0003599, partial [Colletotrichum scovillei]